MYLAIRIVVLSLLFSLMFYTSGARAGVTADQITAVYLYNFLSYITWDNRNVGDGANICIYGNRDVNVLLETIQKQNPARTSFKVKNINESKDIMDCHIAFLDRRYKNKLQEFVAANSNALTVSNIDDFTLVGGMIGFVQKGDNIKLQVNLTNVRERNIKISSRLLKIAEVVDE